MNEFGINKILFILFFFTTFSVVAQENKELTKIYKILDKFSSDDYYTLNEINLVNLTISKREKYLKQLNSQLTEINTEILNITNTTKKLEIELTTSKSIYEQLIYFAFLNRYKFNSYTFIFSTSDISEIYNRLKFLKLITQYRKKVIDAINFIKVQLANQKDILLNYSEIKTSLIEQINSEKSDLETDSEYKLKAIEYLQQTNDELRNDLLYREDLYTEILELLSSGNKSIDKEEIEKTVAFEQLKGKFELPVEDGVIIKQFGEYQHPTLNQVKIKNDGIDIIPDDNYDVRCVADGLVTDIISIPGKNRAVLIKHGDYYTVYTNLVDVDVNANQKVTAKQIIGSISDDDEEVAVLNFQIWYLTDKQDPEDWIKN